MVRIRQSMLALSGICFGGGLVLALFLPLIWWQGHADSHYMQFIMYMAFGGAAFYGASKLCRK